MSGSFDVARQAACEAYAAVAVVAADLRFFQRGLDFVGYMDVNGQQSIYPLETL
jgi:hypothetical protein